MQPCDVLATATDSAPLEAWSVFNPNKLEKQGLAKFVTCYLQVYGLGNSWAPPFTFPCG